ncbi:hypothetical protein HUJ04_010199, partial [Dendroctonus ponderosae]
MYFDSQVLSVGYVMISSEVEHVCGRCITLLEYRNYEFSFPCLYTYLGCLTNLSIFEMSNHEQQCSAVALEPSEVYCRLCTFKGPDMVDMVMHMRRCHLEEALFEGAKTIFSITVDQKLSILFFLEDWIFLMHLEYNRPTTSLFVTIDCLSVVRPRLFSVKIQNPDDPSNHVLLQSTNGVNISLVVIRKNYGQLNDIFGLNTVLSYELIVENLDLSLEEHDLQLRSLDLRKTEQAFERIIGRLNLIAKTTNKKFDTHKQILDILKYIAPIVLKCSNCNIINPGIKHYICSEGHIYCRACVHPKCEACKEFREFNSVNDLLKQGVVCDWPDCDIITELHYYISHKAACSHRTYFCPLKGCHQYFTFIPELAVHWHAATPGLIENNSNIVCCKGAHQDHDIYRVLVNISENIQIIVEDFDVVLTNSKIYCYGIKDDVREEIPSSNICGCFQVFVNNRQAENPDEFVYDKVKIQM